jgi:hypothetical protein
MEDQDDIEQVAEQEDDSAGDEQANGMPGFGSSRLGGGDPMP